MTPAGPRIPVEKISHVDLWKHFESHGAQVKNTMFTVVTWILTLTIGLLAFIVKSFMSFKPALSLSNPILMASFCLLGIGIVYYARLTLLDFAGHINRNFDRADCAREGDKTLDEIWNAGSTNKKIPAICKKILNVIYAMGILFAIGFLYGIVTWLTCA